MVAFNHGAEKLVAGAGLQRETGDGGQQAVQRQMILLQHVKGLLLDLAQQIVKLDQPQAITGHLRSAAAFAAGGTFDHRLLGQLIHFIDGIPGAFVADPRQFGSLADRAGMHHLLEQRDAAWVSEQFLLQL
ncbi:hypothetical protein D3C76_1412260 [compost metagenome]